MLDYGCNQGGFLRMLYDRHPFKSAVGIDIARESVARADLLKGHRPVEYKVADSAASLGRTFDYAFSHEVIYLLGDLAAHARDMKAALTARRLLCRGHGLPHRQRGLAALAQADRRDLVDPDLRPFAGRCRRRPSERRVSPSAVRPLDLDAFMPVTVGSVYFPKVVDQLRYYSQDKVLFRFVRTP